MLTFPCAKINLGLNVTSERPDGYHDIETVFYPIPLTDVIEIKHMDPSFPHTNNCDLKVTFDPSIGTTAIGNGADNLVVKAYNLLERDFTLPPIHAHLYKRIPSQAGLGGGSSDGAFMIRLLDERFRLNIGIAEMERYAAELGSDCPFFISAEPSFATGRGEVLEPADSPRGNLEGYFIGIVKPVIAVSTREAYQQIQCRQPEKSCRAIVRQPIDTWREELINDFEAPVFRTHPELQQIKDRLYSLGAVYAAMSGSGSALFGIFRKAPQEFAALFPGCFTFSSAL